MKRTTIKINGKDFTYNDELDDINYTNISEISVDNALSLLQTTKYAFANCNISYFLAFGTLLGAVRDKGIIKGDEDVDIMTFDEDKLYNSLPTLDKNGLHLCRMIKGEIYSFRNGSNDYIDVYILKNITYGFWSFYCVRWTYKYYPKSYLSKFEEIDFLGEKFPIPFKPERILKTWYGKTWNIPIRGHDMYYSEITSHYLWRRFITSPAKKFLTHLFYKLLHKK